MLHSLLNVWTSRLLVFVFILLVRAQGAEGPAETRGRNFIGLTNLATFFREQRAAELILTSPRLGSPIAWNQLIVSWNAEMSAAHSLKIEARGVYADHATRFYTLALWSTPTSPHPRESVNGQKDADGDVLTDTLALNRPGAQVELRLTLGTTNDLPFPSLKFLGLSFCDTKVKPTPRAAHKAAWGRTLDVPERSQMAYPGGEVWCSPTAISMVLAHWGRVSNRADLTWSVPEVAQAVFDKNWPGTGNWPFNTAFAGSFPGVRAYVTRLNDLADIEGWIARGVPVITSVSYNALKGQEKKPNDGHLVVCVGFTETGDPIFNDPGVKEGVRRVYPREHFANAWAYSHQTVYLIHTEP